MSRKKMLSWAVAATLPLVATPGELDGRLGRNEVRVYSAPHVVRAGTTVAASGLPERLEQLGYRRVRDRPEGPGEYFWGHEVFWIHPREAGPGGRATEPVALGLRRSDGAILTVGDAAAGQLSLEPLLLAESLAPDRALRYPIRLDDLPEHLWRAVLATEDARFFEHRGVDGRSVARALLRNAREGKVVQGGSTITQQLIKLRDLSPRRTVGRKLSEALRALALEARFDKREILEAYLNAVYFGHVDGRAVHGIGTAIRVFFSKSPGELQLGESALLAAMIQGPNRLSPLRHPERALARQRWVLSRLEDLEWADSSSIRQARQRGLPELRLGEPEGPRAAHLLRWLAEEVERRVPDRVERGRGFVVETTLDPWVQSLAERAVVDGLAEIRRRRPRGLPGGVTAALVALDARDGRVLAYVGGDPAAVGDQFDRARKARRQPGSTIKPLVLLEAFQDCGKHDALYPSRGVSDLPLRLELPSGEWEPVNPDRRNRDRVTIHDALVESLNLPFVRIGRRCGFDRTADRLRRAGLRLAEPPPPSFVLGSLEMTPLELVQAYTVFANRGRRLRAVPFRAILKPDRTRIARGRPRERRVVGPGTAYLIRDLLVAAVEDGTARGGRLDGHTTFGKTGTSSGSRDAWFVGGAGSVVTVVWVGADDGSSVGGSGATLAAPIWKAFMERAVPARPELRVVAPARIVERWVETSTGLRLAGPRRGATRELFRRGHEPPRRYLLLPDAPIPPIE